MSTETIRLVIPTGRLYDPIVKLLDESGISIPKTAKNYRPKSNDDRFQIKLLKAANVPKLLELGAHDIGFSGLDWVRETGARVTTLLDTGILPVRVVAAAPRGANPLELKRGRPVVVASEYEQLTREFMDSKQVDWTFIRTYGATEVFPPEDADLIVDNTATGAALEANRLEIVGELLTSTAQFLANPAAMERPFVRDAVEDLTLLMNSVLEARRRVLLEINVDSDRLEQVIALLPAMKSPTIQPLRAEDGFAVKAAVPTAEVARLLPKLKKAGATDILETNLRRVTP